MLQLLLPPSLSEFWVLKQTSISFIVENNLNLKWGITTYGKLRAKVVLFDKI